jgi:cell division protein FtsB
MKGVKTMSVANGTAKRFQADDIVTHRVHLPGGDELVAVLAQMKAENKKLAETVKDLTGKVKELQDKYDALETE